MHPEQITGFFKLKGSVRGITPVGNGHINDTFRLINAEPSAPDYLLQRINHEVFRNVPELMMNIWQVTGHIKEKVLADFVEYGGQQTLTIISTRDNRLFHRDEKGNYWRMFIYLKDLHSFDGVPSVEQIYEGAKAFGHFLKILADFPLRGLKATIPDFHDVILRQEYLKRAVERNQCGRLQRVEDLVDFAFRISGQMAEIEKLGRSGKLPRRVTHNDCKFNNVMLDQNGKGRCVIDLDTVMPGLVHYDFGDGVRTTTSTVEEDEADLQRIQVDLPRYEAFANGYLEAAGDLLQPLEVEYLALSGALFAYLMGIRFLTDYLEGDVYYKTRYPEQNFRRARCQLDLTGKLLEARPQLDDITRKQYRRYAATGRRSH